MQDGGGVDAAAALVFLAGIAGAEGVAGGGCRGFRAWGGFVLRNGIFGF
jgi:hypothetical protein